MKFLLCFSLLGLPSYFCNMDTPAPKREIPVVVPMIANAPVPVVKVPPRGRISTTTVCDFIKENEGFSAVAYQDTWNKSVGYGYNLDADEKEARSILKSLGLDYNTVRSGRAKLNKVQANAILKIRVKQAFAIADDWCNGLDDHPYQVQMVLVDLAYNLGPANFNNFHRTRNAIIARDYKGAAWSLSKTKWYKQVGERGKKVCQILRSVK